MEIDKTAPLTVPEKTYDKWWLREIRITADAPGKVGGKTSLTSTLYPFRSDGGTDEILGDGAKRAVVNIPDLLDEAGKTLEVQAALDALTAAIEKVGKAGGLL